MDEISNSQIIHTLLKTLYKKISRRTNDANATDILNRVIKDLSDKHQYLSEVKIEDTHYRENENNIIVADRINKIGSDYLNKILKDIIELTIRYLKRDADYFFIKEFKEAIGSTEEFDLDENDIDLNLMQFKYIVNRKQILTYKNSEILSSLVKGLQKMIIRYYSYDDTFDMMNRAINDSYKKFDFLESIKIFKSTDSNKLFKTDITSDIDNIPSYQFAKAINTIIEDIGRSLDPKIEDDFIEILKKELEIDDLLSLKKIGVNLNNIKHVLSKPDFDMVIKKIFNVLFSILNEEKSPDVSAQIIENILIGLKEKFVFLDYIKINHDEISLTEKTFIIKPDIKNIEPYKLAKALREIIIQTEKNMSQGRYMFLNEFKDKLGEDFVFEIEKIGVNLHFLEMKFSLTGG
jgi:hypothetical protein